MLRLLCFIIAISTSSALAEVTAKGETGFNLKISRAVPVEPAAAYNQFLKVDEWWIKGHTWFGSAENLSIDASAGGCFCEIDGERQVHHMLVTFVDPSQEIKLTGGLGPLQMMGVHGGMSWRFETAGTGTEIVLSYNVSGFAPGGLLDLAEVVDAILTAQLEALIAQLERSN